MSKIKSNAKNFEQTFFLDSKIEPEIDKDIPVVLPNPLTPTDQELISIASALFFLVDSQASSLSKLSPNSLWSAEGKLAGLRKSY